MKTSPTTEDRVWAVIAHLSSLAFGMGIVLPIVGWADQRRKSNYGSFQNLQALGYQSLGFTVWILAYLVIVIIASIVVIATVPAEGTTDKDILSSPGMIALLIVLLAFLALYLVLPIVAAIACALGKDFRYPILGNRLARYLGYDPLASSDESTWLVEEHEFRWVAAMGHFSVLIVIWGMLAPLTTWVLYGKRNLFLKFQSIQTLIYQAGVTLLSLGAGLFYTVGVSIFVAAVLYQPSQIPSVSEGLIGLMLLFGCMLLIPFFVLLIIPLFHILGQWAGYRVLKGDDYHYPWLGHLVEKRISKPSLDT